MKIVAAPNAFKGSMTASSAAAAIRQGINRIDRGIVVAEVPVADGGDGLAEILCRALSGEMFISKVAGPLFEEVEAPVCFIKQNLTGVVEMALASGLELVDCSQRNPEKTTTFGTGQLISKCLDLNAEKIVVGLGGSATCDGGIGAAAALGYRFLDKNGKMCSPTGEDMVNIAAIDLKGVDPRIYQTEVVAVCDVDNLLFGSNGASFVYSPQKGADQSQVQRLDEGLQNLAAVIQQEMGIDVANLPGAGAAGGLGAGIYAFFGGELKKGIELVLDIVDLEKHIEGADLVITGEGRIDNQTKFDKAPAGVAKAAREAGVPCIALCGSIGEGIDELYDVGIDAVFSLCREPVSLPIAMENGGKMLADAAEQAVRLFMCLKRQ